MFKIQYDGNGYKLSTGDNRPVHARSVAEIHEAIDHWFNSSSLHYNGNREPCPMCRQVASRMEKAHG